MQCISIVYKEIFLFRENKASNEAPSCITKGGEIHIMLLIIRACFGYSVLKTKRITGTCSDITIVISLGMILKEMYAVCILRTYSLITRYASISNGCDRFRTTWYNRYGMGPECATTLRNRYAGIFFIKTLQTAGYSILGLLNSHIYLKIMESVLLHNIIHPIMGGTRQRGNSIINSGNTFILLMLSCLVPPKDVE